MLTPSVAVTTKLLSASCVKDVATENEVPPPLSSVEVGGQWVGSSEWRVGRQLERFVATVLDDGPLFARVEFNQQEATIPGPGRVRITEALSRLIELYTAIDKPDEAAKWQAERAKFPAPEPMPNMKNEDSADVRLRTR